MFLILLSQCLFSQDTHFTLSFFVSSTICFFTSSALWVFLEAMITFAPHFANSVAAAFPSPALPPEDQEMFRLDKSILAEFDHALYVTFLSIYFSKWICYRKIRSPLPLLTNHCFSCSTDMLLASTKALSINSSYASRVDVQALLLQFRRIISKAFRGSLQLKVIYLISESVFCDSLPQPTENMRWIGFATAAPFICMHNIRNWSRLGQSDFTVFL